MNLENRMKKGNIATIWFKNGNILTGVIEESTVWNEGKNIDLTLRDELNDVYHWSNYVEGGDIVSIMTPNEWKQQEEKRRTLKMKERENIEKFEAYNLILKMFADNTEYRFFGNQLTVKNKHVQATIKFYETE